ncbi:lasso peptide biosynthesis B2 protein [Pseudorhodoplanes sp.]|uniref:lasso peptide biosynthesis B2 protein n=1 Tax=Pseudorhodoplanes sp. TaxID=1934341 RepID=UPI003D0EC36B
MTPRAMRRAYLREAAVILALARLAVHILPANRVFAWADWPLRRVRRFETDQAEWVAWAVDHAATLPGMKALCLPRALAAHAMLRRRGIASRLCLGVANNDGELAAHAWIEVGEKTLVGGGEAVAFQRLATFGGRGATTGLP